MNLRLHHVALRVADPEAAAAFYAGLLGLVVVRSSDAAVWLRSGETVLMLERRLRGDGPTTGSGHLLAFAVDDLAEWERRLAERGIAVEDRTDFTLYLRDPDGHRVGLSAFRFA